MATAQHKTKAAEAITLLSSLLEERIQPDELSSKRIRRQLMDSMKADASEAYAGLGILETLLWNLPEVERNFNKAIQIESEFTVHSNYSISLSRLGKILEAAEQSRIAATFAPTDISAVLTAVHYSMVAGELTIAKSWAERLRKLTPSEEPEEATAVDSILAALDKNGMSEQVIQRCNQLAFDLVAEDRVVVRSVSSEVDLQDGIVLFSVELDSDTEKTEELDSRLCLELFAKVTEYDPSKYWIGFVPRGKS